MPAGAKRQLSPVGHGVGGIEGEIDDHLLQLDRIDVERQLAWRQLGLHMDTAWQDLLKQVKEAFNRLVQILVTLLTRQSLVELAYAMGQPAGLHRRLAD